MAGGDADAHGSGDERDARAALYAQHAPHRSHHEGAVGAAQDASVLQWRQCVRCHVMAVCHSQHPAWEVVLAPHNCRLYHPLDVHHCPCRQPQDSAQPMHHAVSADHGRDRKYAGRCHAQMLACLKRGAWGVSRVACACRYTGPCLRSVAIQSALMAHACTLSCVLHLLKAANLLPASM